MKYKKKKYTILSYIEVPRIKGAYAEVISYNRKNLE